MDPAQGRPRQAADGRRGGRERPPRNLRPRVAVVDDDVAQPPMVADRGIAPPPYLTRALFALEDAEFPRTFCYVSEVVDGQQGVGVFAVTTGIQLRVFLQDVFQSGGSVSDVQLAVLLPGNPTVTLMTLPGGILGVSEHAMLSLLKCYFLVGVTARRM